MCLKKMFHVEQIGLDKKFWRGGASSSTTTIFSKVPCAIISSRTTIVKSFLRVWTKFFAIRMVFWCGRANYTVVGRRCQVLFAGIVQIILLDKSLRGRYNLRKFRKTPERVRKFRIILVNYSKKFLTEKPRARPPGIRLRLVYDQFRKINS